MMLALLFAFCVALLCYWVARYPRQYWSLRGVGHVSFLQTLRNMARMYYMVSDENAAHLFTSYGRRYIGHMDLLQVHSPCSLQHLWSLTPLLLKEIMIKNFASFPNTEFITQVGDPVLDNMLVALLNNEWRTTRKIVSPVFSTSKIKQMFVTANECAKDMIRNFADGAREGTPCDVKLVFGAFALDVTAQSTFSFRLDSHRDVNNPFVLQAKRFFAAENNWRAFFSFQFPRLSKMLGLRIFCPDAVEYFSGVMTDLLQRRVADNKNEKTDFVHLLMNAECKEEDRLQQKDTSKRGLTKDQVLAQAVLFFVAGYDTTTIAMSMAVYYLAQHKHIQERLIEEIEHVLQQQSDITYEVVMGLPVSGRRMHGGAPDEPTCADDIQNVRREHSVGQHTN
ncbi:hypothetical protein MTO96_020269 [Rhipicephalus appendiculatus]